MMELGLLPALGDGIAELRRTGQASRFVDGYLAPYARAFDRVWYASYLPESLRDYTADAHLLASVQVLAPRRRRPRVARALAMPWAHRRELRRCAVLRAFQITGTIPALALRARWGTPFVTSYGFWHARLSRGGPAGVARRLLERVALRRAAAVIVPTADLAAHVATVAPAGRIHLVPNGVDVSRFKPRGRRETTVPEIVYVGRLSQEKNLSALVSAVAMLRGGAGSAAGVPRPAARLVMVGDGPQRAALEAQARAARVELELPGVVDHARVPEWLERADVFALPSFTEGHPKVLVEAMAAGLPCVVSDCAGNRAVVQDGRTGLVFEAGDPAALAAQLERVLSDDALAAALGARAREVAARDFDLARLVEREIALLMRVAREGGA
jgi:glycosyltransferase involved in cell wall biosynthesis